MKNNKRLLMVSFDAVGSQDIDYLKQLPNFAKLVENGTLTKDVSSVFVSNTYPAHTSIQTGMNPKSHGIIDNCFIKPNFKGNNWNYSSKKIKAPTLINRATQEGLSTCCVLYPVTGYSKARWNFPEIAHNSSVPKKLWTTVKCGSPFFVIASVIKYVSHFLKGGSKNLDIFTTKIAVNVLANKKPNLTMVHLLNTDIDKHTYGPGAKEITTALKNLDDRLGELIRAFKSTSENEQNDSIIVFSDHNCLDVHSLQETNALLKKAGFLETDAQIHDAGGVCFAKLHNTSRKEEFQLFCNNFINEKGIERFLSKEEMEISGANQVYDYGFSAKTGFSFGEFHKGQHGYTLDRDNYFAFYLASGNKIRKNVTKSGDSILDICPLASDLLGILPRKTEGQNTLF